ncbi:SRPBCC domain-containing protein [Amycolatopsis sp. NPDC049688]|uniref:SRPBCC domain-containing protein n=1 Tax=Amycolatopsis sp. NPDC049688 TaxID=3154733 RepID=UPI003429921E
MTGAEEFPRTSLSFTIYLRAAPLRVWQALIAPDLVPLWRFGMSLRSDWQPCSVVRSTNPHGTGVVHTVIPPYLLTYSWSRAGDLESGGEHLSTVSFELEPLGETTQLTVRTRQFDQSGTFIDLAQPEWPMMLSSLKSLLETGRPLRYSPAPGDPPPGDHAPAGLPSPRSAWAAKLTRKWWHRPESG